ncbi:MAG: magnesium transporter [Clostridia bacterium]|nr:magnesium transporter [Clostridia bacterium]
MENRMFDPASRDPRAEILILIQETIDPSLLREKLADYHHNDIAAALEELNEEQTERLSLALGIEVMSDIVSFMEDAGDYLSTLDADEAAELIEQMDADDAVEILDEMDEELREEVLGRIEDEEIREDLELLRSYEDDEIGSRMSTNFIVIGRHLSIKDAMRTLIAEAEKNDNISTLFITEEDGRYYGTLDLKDLIIARSTDSLESLISTAFPRVYDKEPISECVERLREYSEDLIPVLSEQDILLGVITAHDLAELIDEERADDYAKLAALGSEEERKDSLFSSMKKRVPWLVILLFLGLAVSAVVGFFEGVVEELPMLVAFQSLILGMAGNVGTQSLAVTVRGLGTESPNTEKMRIWLVFKETRIAFLNGLALGLISFGIVLGYLSLLSDYSFSLILSVAGCVGIAMLFAMIISGFTGAAIPLLLDRLGTDPAVASGPLITTINDLAAVVSYYGLAWVLLLNLPEK